MRQDIREQVRERYAAAAQGDGAGCCGGDAGCCGGETGCCGAETAGPNGQVTDEPSGTGHYGPQDAAQVPAKALAASLGSGNPVTVAELNEGERVLDLGSGGGLDVLLSARRVGPTGFAYGVDMTDEMLDLARANAAEAGAVNVEFRKGVIEDLPFESATVDVVISNCVLNLSPDKTAVLSEAFRVLTPDGRLGISDIVAEDHLTPAQRAERGSHVGCIAGALSRTEYLEGLTAAGFIDADVEFTHPAVDGMHAAIVRARKPATEEA